MLDGSELMHTTSRNEDLADLDKLRELEDYHEGVLPTEENIAYLGTLDNNNAYKRHLRDEQVISFYKKGNIIGTVLNPEGRSDEWTYERNQAFMLGAIEANKTFQLVTPVREYNKEFISVTVDELLWLKDNNYQFKHGADGKLLCTPPETGVKNPIIRNYKLGAGQYTTTEINETKNEILGFSNKPKYQPPHAKKSQQAYQEKIAGRSSTVVEKPIRAEKDKTAMKRYEAKPLYQPPYARRSQSENQGRTSGSSPADRENFAPPFYTNNTTFAQRTVPQESWRRQPSMAKSTDFSLQESQWRKPVPATTADGDGDFKMEESKRRGNGRGW